MDELVERAIAAWKRSDIGRMNWPSNDSDVITHGRRRYVRLINRHGVLAVYSVGKCDRLRRLGDWPKALDVAAH
jgi:hypothetical protein